MHPWAPEPTVLLAHNQLHWGRLLTLSPERVKSQNLLMLLSWSSATAPTVPYMHQLPPCKVQQHQWCVWTATYDKPETEHYHRGQSKASLMPDTSAQQPCEASGKGSRQIHNLSKKTCSQRSWTCNASFPGYSRELIFFRLFSDTYPHWGVYFCDKFHKTFVQILVQKIFYEEKKTET